MNYKVCCIISGLSIAGLIAVGCCSSLFISEIFPLLIGYACIAGMILPFAIKVVGDSQ